MNANRRAVINAGLGLAAIAAGALTYEGVRLFGKHYPATPYDDLFARLADREAAKRIGAKFLLDHPAFTPVVAARALRQRLGNRDLTNVLQQEAASGALTEAGHWIVPQTLAGLCALASRAG